MSDRIRHRDRARMIEGRDIVILCGMHFHAEYWTSKQHIAGALLRKNNVLFVERRPWAGEIRRWFSLLTGGVTREKGGPSILPALYLIPGNYRWSIVNKMNQLLTLFFVRWAVKRLNFRRTILWSFVHDVPLVLQGVEGVKIYHCVDNWKEFPRWDRKLARCIEERTAKISDVIFASAKDLAGRLKKWNSETYYFPNAVDLDGFRPSSARRLPADLSQIPGPRICYMGTLEMWFDTSLMRDLVRKNPRWSFVFFGALGKNFTGGDMFSHPNVYYLGLKGRKDLCAYIMGCDVCIIPFKVNALTRSVSPLKLFEYFACGKPVVSTDLPEVSRFVPLVRIAGSPAAFERAVRESLKERRSLSRRRINEAHAHSWTRRVEEYSRIISTKLRAYGRKHFDEQIH